MQVLETQAQSHQSDFLGLQGTGNQTAANKKQKQFELLQALEFCGATKQNTDTGTAESGEILQET